MRLCLPPGKGHDRTGSERFAGRRAYRRLATKFVWRLATKFV